MSDQKAFGYFPRHKYNDIVFYVKTGEHSNQGLFEMPDTPETRELMEALIPKDCQKHDEQVRKEERERVLNLYKDFVKVRIAQGISGVSFYSVLTYLSHPSDVENDISAVCAVSGKSIEQLREIAETRIKLESLRGEP